MKMKQGFFRSSGGWTRVDGVTVLALVLVLGVLATTALGKMRPQAQRATCASNLRELGVAWKSWASEHDNLPPWYVMPAKGGSSTLQIAYLHYLVLSNYVETPAIFVCPGDAEKVTAKDFSGNTNGLKSLKNKAISYFFATEINMEDPRCYLAGDGRLNGGFSTCIGSSTIVMPTPLPVKKLSTWSGGGWNAAVHGIGIGNLLFVDGSARMSGLEELYWVVPNSEDANGSGCAMVPEP
jgi:hypothetical protein